MPQRATFGMTQMSRSLRCLGRVTSKPRRRGKRAAARRPGGRMPAEAGRRCVAGWCCGARAGRRDSGQGAGGRACRVEGGQRRWGWRCRRISPPPTPTRARPLRLVVGADVRPLVCRRVREIPRAPIRFLTTWTHRGWRPCPTPYIRTRPSPSCPP